MSKPPPRGQRWCTRTGRQAPISLFHVIKEELLSRGLFAGLFIEGKSDLIGILIDARKTKAVRPKGTRPTPLLTPVSIRQKSPNDEGTYDAR